MERLHAQREGRWDTALPGTLQGKTMGLVGVGSIGAHLAATAEALRDDRARLHQGDRGLSEVDHYFHRRSQAGLCRGLDYLVAVLPNTPGHAPAGGCRACWPRCRPTRWSSTRAVATPRHRGPHRGARTTTPRGCRARRVRRGAAASRAPAVADAGVFISSPYRRTQLSRPTSSASSWTTIAVMRVGEALRYQVDFDRGY